MCLVCMRFGKKLALAKLHDADEAPYVSQKQLKHILVGLEKLCKSYSEQVMLLLNQSMTHADLVLHVNTERAKFGLAQRSSLLEESEVIAHDFAFFSLLNNDVVDIRRYVERCECVLMVGVNEWLEAAAIAGVVVGPNLAELARNGPEFAKCVLHPIVPSNELIEELRGLCDEFNRLSGYIEVNRAAMRKLIGRRNKNVAECFWSRHEYDGISALQTPETSLLIDTIETIKRSILPQLVNS